MVSRSVWVLRARRARESFASSRTTCLWRNVGIGRVYMNPMEVYILQSGSPNPNPLPRGEGVTRGRRGRGGRGSGKCRRGSGGR
jgi:hypothetical protein